MMHPLKNVIARYVSRFSRRELFRGGGALSLPALFPNASGQSVSQSSGLRTGADIYRSIGVKPLINCRGTFTIVGGSLELPEVRAAKEAAANNFVHLDELMDAIGVRLSELTGAESGIVTSGCAAGLAHATAACVAGGNPDRHVRIPNLTGFPKDEVIIPKPSRNVYDSAIRSIGVKIIEVHTPEELELAIGPKTAMIYIFAGPRADTGPLAFEVVTRMAKQRSIPVLVDAAAEILTVPNVHLQRGATLVGYSGGKCLRGPQCAGILIGRKDLIKAAWIHSAPHHGYGRSMKVGKEEAMGMLMAVEMWAKRDHDAEWKNWMSAMEHIAKRLSAIDGVKSEVRESKGLSNRTPGLSVRWDSDRFGMTGADVARILFTTEPRIALSSGFGRRGEGPPRETGVSISAYMMSPGDEKVVADRLHAVLSKPLKAAPKQPTPPAADVSGRWAASIQFAGSASEHTLFLQQDGTRIVGTHQGDFVSRDLSGSMDGATVRFVSSYTEENGDNLMFDFAGTVTAEGMSGTLDMGEYRSAQWTAKKKT